MQDGRTAARSIGGKNQGANKKPDLQRRNFLARARRPATRPSRTRTSARPPAEQRQIVAGYRWWADRLLRDIWRRDLEEIGSDVVETRPARAAGRAVEVKRRRPTATLAVHDLTTMNEPRADEGLP